MEKLVSYGLRARIEEVMRREVITIESSKTAWDAARLIAEKGIGCLVVVKDSKVTGIVTERDIVIRVIAQGLDPRKTLIEEFMTKRVITYPPTATVSEVIQAMSRHRIRRIPVVDEGKLVGIVTAWDIALLGCPWMPAH